MATPMQIQYNKLKKQYDDCLLLFRLGDFYECFNNDAKIISKVLNIVLTSRGKGENRHLMAGLPYHALDNYLPKLVNAGYKVAIAEQMEKPQQGKKIVERDVVKIISAGTITDEKSLSENKNNYICSVVQYSEKSRIMWGMALSDITTGEFTISEFSSKNENVPTVLLDELKRISPSELLISKDNISSFKNELIQSRLQIFSDSIQNPNDARRLLTKHLQVKTLKGFGVTTQKAGVFAAGVLLDYLMETQKSNLEHINSITLTVPHNYMVLDESTIRSLELVYPLREDSSSTLLSVIDTCMTSMGRRKLYQWILRPLIKREEIIERHEGVQEFFKNSTMLEDVRILLDDIFDIERILGRIGTGTINARDLLALKNSLLLVQRVIPSIESTKSQIIKKLKKDIVQKRVIKNVIKKIEGAIVDDPPNTITEGGIFKKGYHKELDTYLTATTGGKEWINELQQSEQKRTGISSLKVKFNKVFGFYIEVSRSNLDKVPDDYVRKQTLVNAERFITEGLKEKEELILQAESKSVELEYQLFSELRQEISQYIPELQLIATAIATLDCISNFAHVARIQSFVKPDVLSNGTRALQVINGRHPVVEAINDEKFIPNNIDLDNKKKQIAIITGPNMSGKSTYIRQVAILVLLAQIGSFIPADAMRFSPVDRIFTRVGASDNLAGGESTFLVEMSETANILNNATENSLIILDEVGRGTSTYDGVAIAWAVSEYIHEHIGAKTLFATHYHELLDLKKYLKRVVNLHVAVSESKEKVLFLRKIEEGGTDKSYGVHVAGLAGVPSEVIDKSKEILMGLEQEGMFEVKHIESEVTETQKSISKQMPLLMSLPENPAIKKLQDLDINKLTPLQALEKLDELQKLSKDTP